MADDVETKYLHESEDPDGAEMNVGDGVTAFTQPYDEKLIKELAREAPETRFRHPSYFTDDEDKIIAAGIKSGQALYRIADTLKCNRTTLVNHINNTPALAQIRKDAEAQEKDEVEEGLKALIRMNHPAVLMWKAEKLIPEKYGKYARADEEEQVHIVFGAPSEELLEKGDRLLADAASKPPEVGLAALLDVENMKKVEEAVAGDAENDSLPSVNLLPDKRGAQTQPDPPRHGQFVEDAQPSGATSEYGDGFGGGDAYGGDSFDSGSWLD